MKGLIASAKGVGEKGFTTLIVTCGRMGSWEKAIAIFDSMHLQGLQPNSYTYGALISVCCSAGECDRALQYFEQMKACAVRRPECTPDALVYKNLVPECVKHGKFDLVLTLYKEIVAAGIKVDKNTLSSILDSTMRRRRWDVAGRVLDDVHSSDMVLAPKTYTKLITACADHGDLDDALQFFLVMQMVGLTANTYSCRGLMRAIETAERADMGIELVQGMRQNEIYVSNETYNSLLRVLAKCGEWDELLNLVNEMKKAGLGISIESMALITKCRANQLPEGDATGNMLISKMNRVGVAINPTDAQGWSIGVGSPLSARSTSSGLS